MDGCNEAWVDRRKQAESLMYIDKNILIDTDKERNSSGLIHTEFLGRMTDRLI